MASSPNEPTDDFEDLFENGAVAIHLVGKDGTILRANRAELDLLGYPADEYIGRNIRDFHADEDTINDILNRLSGGQQLDWYPARLRAKDGSIKHVEITSSVRFREGDFVNTRCFTRDVTELRRAQAQVKEKERYLEQLLNALPAAIYTTDAKGKVTYFNEEAVRLAGRVPQLGSDECVTWRLRNHDGTPLPHAECPMAIALKEDRPVRGVIAYAERPDGSLLPFMPYPTPLYDERGELTGGINMLVDVTDQQKRQEQIEFVMRELLHRSKNLLAVVMAVANRSIRSSKDLDEFAPKFINRLEAMARAHDLLVANSWAGADIREIVRAELAGFFDNDHDARAKFKGSSIILNPNVAQSLSLAVHELATNAAKYGAFRADGGSVEIEWKEADAGSIAFAWRERVNVPEAEPSRKGFGSHVLSSVFRNSKFQLTPSGLDFSGVLDHAGVVNNRD